MTGLHKSKMRLAKEVKMERGILGQQFPHCVHDRLCEDFWRAPAIMKLWKAKTGPKASWKFATWNPEMLHCFGDGTSCGHELVVEQCTKSIISYAMQANWKLKTSWEPTSKYKAWTNVRLLFLKRIWKPESVCLACLLPPAYSTWCLHQNKTFTLHVVCRVHSSEIHLALSLLPVLTLCQYGTGRPVQFHRWFSRTLGRWCAFKVCWKLRYRRVAICKDPSKTARSLTLMSSR